jgi:beta-lactamase class A
MIRKTLVFLIAISISASTSASYSSITKKIEHLEKEHNIKIGVSAIHIESGKFFHNRADERFKMASTMKLPVAIYLLDKVNRNKVNLKHMIHLEPYDLIPGSGCMGYFLTYPSLAISVHNLLESMMAISDNTSTDVLLDYVGGTKAVMGYLKEKEFKDISIDNDILGRATSQTTQRSEADSKNLREHSVGTKA